jgi:hypothetical protein
VLSQECACSTRALTKAIAALDTKGVLRRITGTGVTGKTSRYWFPFDKDAMMEALGGSVEALVVAWGV